MNRLNLWGFRGVIRQSVFIVVMYATFSFISTREHSSGSVQAEFTWNELERL